ncbi:MAG: serine/threonine protein kinase [Myxococcota bacterium]|jgi:serine/threonine protein kinase
MGTEISFALPESFVAHRRLGQKSTSTTWEATRVGSGARVAVRCGGVPQGAYGLELPTIAPLLWDEDAVCAPIAHERAVLTRVAGPGVPKLSEGDDPTNVLATCWIDDAVSLESLTPLSPSSAQTVLVALLHIVARAHRCGVVHRDITPANILIGVGNFESIWLLDWELASDDGRQLFGPVGTSGFMAPELLALRANPRRKTSPSVDVFGVGASVYFALTGQRPFGQNVLEIVNGRPLDTTQLSVSDAAIFKTLLARDEQARPRDATDALAMIRGTAAPPSKKQPRQASLDAALAQVDAGQVHKAARMLDRVGTRDRASAALGYAYLCWRLDAPALSTSLLIEASATDGLRDALVECLGGPLAPTLERGRARRSRQSILLASAALQREDWHSAFALLSTDLPDPPTLQLLRSRVELLTSSGEALSLDRQAETTLWAGVLALSDETQLKTPARLLAVRAYPGPGRDATFLSDHAFLTAACNDHPLVTAKVAASLMVNDGYPVHYQTGLWPGGLQGPADAFAASLIELGCKTRALEFEASLEAVDWPLRTRLLIACGELDRARTTLEKVFDHEARDTRFSQLHMAQLLYSGRPHVAIHVYDRARTAFGDDASQLLHPLAVFAMLRSGKHERAHQVADVLKQSADPTSRWVLQMLSSDGEAGVLSG